MNGYNKGTKFNLSFLIQICYLAGDHLLKNVELLTIESNMSVMHAKDIKKVIVHKNCPH